MDVRAFFAQKLAERADHRGWWNWYAVQKSPRMLIGAGGFNGPPDASGTATLGYAVLPGFEGQGYATELAEGLVRWATRTTQINRIFATTFERHHASVRVLEKNGFLCNGISAEDGAVADSDRQSRGHLMLFVRDIN